MVKNPLIGKKRARRFSGAGRRALFVALEFILHERRAVMVNPASLFSRAPPTMPAREPAIKRCCVKTAGQPGGTSDMADRRKVFRIDQMNGGAAAASAPDDETEAAQRHHQVMAELQALHTLLRPHAAVQHNSESYRAQLAEMKKLKDELDLIYDAINRTKQEIATLHVTGFKGQEMARVSRELGAVVGGTEKATQQILQAAEYIVETANNLSVAVKMGQEAGIAQDIQDRVIQIFEACNFQDLTGQRIAKVMATLQFIEQHIIRMMEIWGGIEAFKDFNDAAKTARDSEIKLVNGPRLDDDAGHASQQDIDALFP
jgi:chemotaxis protein CheZ